jgi:hypothetical protein
VVGVVAGGPVVVVVPVVSVVAVLGGSVVVVVSTVGSVVEGFAPEGSGVRGTTGSAWVDGPGASSPFSSLL